MTYVHTELVRTLEESFDAFFSDASFAPTMVPLDCCFYRRTTIACDEPVLLSRYQRKFTDD